MENETDHGDGMELDMELEGMDGEELHVDAPARPNGPRIGARAGTETGQGGPRFGAAEPGVAPAGANPTGPTGQAADLAAQLSRAAMSAGAEVRSADAGPETAAKAPTGVERAGEVSGTGAGTDRVAQTAEAKAARVAAMQRPEAFDQVIDRTLRMVRVGNREASLQLTPENLGEVKIRVVMERGGVTAELMAQNPSTRELLDMYQNRLQQALLDSGADSAEVNVALGGEWEAADSDANPSLSHDEQAAQAVEAPVAAPAPAPRTAERAGLNIVA